MNENRSKGFDFNTHPLTSRLINVEEAGTDKWRASCPCGRNHKNNDENRSLSVMYDEQNENLLVYCFTGCSLAEICEEVGCSVSDLFFGKNPAGFITWYAKKNGLTFIESYSYCYGSYNDGLCKVRFRKADGTKDFRWMCEDSTKKSGFAMTHKGCKNRLYVAGDINDDTVFVVEGEKDANTLHCLASVTAVSAENGAAKGTGGKWRKEYNEQLADKNVYILWDNDNIGKQFAWIEADEIARTAKAVFLLDLPAAWPECPEKGDISDYVKAVGLEEAANALHEMIASAEEYKDEITAKYQERKHSMGAKTEGNTAPVPDADQPIPGKTVITTPGATESEDGNEPQIITKVNSSISSFVEVIKKHFSIRFNELNQRGEIFANDHWHEITDSDEAIITQYCQDVYNISNRTNLRDALLICQSTNLVNPLTAKLIGLEWDGTPRTANFLHDVMKCDDNPVVREISQMIFTGGIRRAFDPGCKWDNVPVLVGKQGSGKTTAVDLLGLGYSHLLRTFSGDKAIEGLSGVWIGEIGELSAMRKAKDIEEIKSFISARSDKYRKPYAHHDIIIPRRCIFIGTTNSNAFLTDRTGNRRFFPVNVHSDARTIWEHIDEVKEYILQAWAEALSHYRDGTLPTDYDHSIDGELNDIRDGYQNDDWKLGEIEDYLNAKKNGEMVCCLELWINAIGLEKEKMTMSDSRNIGDYLDNHPDWVRISKRPRFDSCGVHSQQRAWIKNTISNVFE